MNFSLLVRRTHLFLGLFLLPWVIMFGVSSLPLNHTGARVQPKWTPIADLPFTADVPAPGGNLRALGAEMMAAAGIKGGFHVNRPNPRQINVNHPNFAHPTRIIYHLEQKRLVAETREFLFRPFITSMHTRGGYNLGGFWDNVWAVFVDLVSAGLLVWIASGLYMWWQISGSRRWGWVALGAGAVSFALIVAKL